MSIRCSFQFFCWLEIFSNKNWEQREHKGLGSHGHESSLSQHCVVVLWDHCSNSVSEIEKTRFIFMTTEERYICWSSTVSQQGRWLTLGRVLGTCGVQGSVLFWRLTSSVEEVAQMRLICIGWHTRGKLSLFLIDFQKWGPATVKWSDDLILVAPYHSYREILTLW